MAIKINAKFSTKVINNVKSLFAKNSLALA